VEAGRFATFVVCFGFSFQDIFERDAALMIIRSTDGQARDNSIMRALIITVISIFGLTVSAAAQVAVAIVEELQGKVDGVEFMDYVAPGKVIKLGPSAMIVLGYMESCWRETIKGGTVIVGAEKSMVHLGDVQRVKVDCDVGGIQLSDREAIQSAGSAFRNLNSNQRAGTSAAPQVTLYGLSPIVEVRSGGTLVVERIDGPGERYTVPLGSNSLLRGRFFDFAKAKKSLTAGGTYAVSLGSRKTTFKIDSHAMPGSTPIIGRLLRF
jgi:hypothetical protein